MFDSIGFQELLVVGLVAMLVIGPKDLPLLMRKLGREAAKLRNIASEFRASFDELARQAELDELRKEVEALKGLKPLNDIQDEFNKVEQDLRAHTQPIDMASAGKSAYGDLSTPAPVADAAAAPNADMPADATAGAAPKKRVRKPKASVENVQSELSASAPPPKAAASTAKKPRKNAKSEVTA